jgi:hypothetical protein
MHDKTSQPPKSCSKYCLWSPERSSSSIGSARTAWSVWQSLSTLDLTLLVGALVNVHTSVGLRDPRVISHIWQVSRNDTLKSQVITTSTLVMFAHCKPMHARELDQNGLSEVDRNWSTGKVSRHPSLLYWCSFLQKWAVNPNPTCNSSMQWFCTL